MTSARRLLPWVAIAFCAHAAAGYAQTIATGAVEGRAVDSSGAPRSGAAVEAASPGRLGGPAVTTTDAQGRFRFSSLPPGAYVLETRLDGYKSVRAANVRVSVGLTAVADFVLEPAASPEIVTLDEPTRGVDPGSSAATVLDDDLLRNLPTSRVHTDTINLSPGVAAEIALGGTKRANRFLVDGFDETDPATGTPLPLFHYNWIRELAVIAPGAGAEHGDFSGAIAAAILHSGGNRASGSADAWMTHPNWVFDNTAELPPTQRAVVRSGPVEQWWDLSAHAGSSLRQDAVWFFGAFAYSRRLEQTPSVPAVSKDGRSRRLLGRATWAPAPSVRVDGFLGWTRLHQTGVEAGANRPLETTLADTHRAILWNGRAAWAIRDGTLLEVQHAGYNSARAVEPAAPVGPAPHFEARTGAFSVTAPLVGRFERKPLTFAGGLTRVVHGWIGSEHEIKLGAELHRATTLDAEAYPGGRLFRDFEDRPYLIELWGGSMLHATLTRLAAYVRDRWIIGDRVTIEPGLRYTANRGSVPGRGRVIRTDPVSPRIGVAWDLFADRGTVLRAHYGRYHDPLVTALFQGQDTTAQHDRITSVWLDPQRIVEVSRVTPVRAPAIDDDFEQPYADQYTAGVERDVMPDFAVRALYVRRQYKRVAGYIDLGSIYDPVLRTDPGPDGSVLTADDRGLVTVYNLRNPSREKPVLTNPAGGTRRYESVQIMGRKRFSRDWQALVAYTWSRTDGLVENLVGSNAALGPLGSFGIFSNPNAAANNNGKSRYDFSHDVELEGTYRVPFWGGLHVGAVYRYLTGQAWGRVVLFRSLFQGRDEVRIEPRGTRRTPSISQIDVRVEKTMGLGATGRTLGLYAEALNLGNQGVPDAAADEDAVNVFASRLLGTPVWWSAPRVLRAGLRVSF